MLFNKLKKPIQNNSNQNNQNNSNQNNSPNKNTSINNSEEKKESSGINGVVNNLFNRKTVPVNNFQQQQQQQQQQQVPQPPKPTILSQTTDVSSILNLQPLREQYKHNFIDAIDFIKNEQLLIDNLNLINNSPPTSPNFSSINGVSSLTAVNNITNSSGSSGGSNPNNNLTSLIIDPKIIGLMNLFIDTTFLKQNGIDKIYELKPGKLETESKNIIYLIRPRVKYMHFITEHIKNHLFDYVKKNYSIIYIPKIDPICDSILEEQGVYGSFSTITSMSLDLIPFDNDVLSMELNTNYREYLLENNKSICFDVAKSIMKLQSLFGLIPILKGKGKASKLVVEILNRLRSEKQQQQKESQINSNNSTGEEMDNQQSSSSTFRSLEISKEIESLILVDRDLDLITPLCTPLTYEGLIDEYFSINNNILLVDSQILTDSIGSVSGKSGGQSSTPHGSMYYNKKSSFPLHSGDKIYSQVRDMNFSSLIGPGGVLNAKAKQQYYEDKKLTGSESLTALRDLMKRINSNKQEEFCLQVHVGIAEKIHEITTSTYFQNRLDCEQKLLLSSDDIYLAEKYIQDCIAIKDPILKILRLLSLYSLTNNGLSLGDYESIKTKIINSYGMDWLIQLTALEKVGLIQIRKSDSKPIGNWPLIKEDLNLIVDDCSETNPTDLAYTYSGYAPLLIRLIQYSLPGSRIGWKSIENVLKLLPGPIFDENQSFFLNSSNNNNSNNTGIPHSNSFPSNINNLNNNNNINQQNVSNLSNGVSSTLNSNSNNINNSNNSNNSNNGNNSNNNGNNIISNSEKPIISLVFFVGGVTFSEISALRFLGKQTNRKFIILTTKLINGDSLVQSFLDQIG